MEIVRGGERASNRPNMQTEGAPEQEKVIEEVFPELKKDA